LENNTDHFQFSTQHFFPGIYHFKVVTRNDLVIDGKFIVIH
jgi:hypothetical protein